MIEDREETLRIDKLRMMARVLKLNHCKKEMIDGEEYYLYPGYERYYGPTPTEFIEMKEKKKKKKKNKPTYCAFFVENLVLSDQHKKQMAASRDFDLGNISEEEYKIICLSTGLDLGSGHIRTTAEVFSEFNDIKKKNKPTYKEDNIKPFSPSDFFQG